MASERPRDRGHNFREVFSEIVKRVLPVVSAHVDAFLAQNKPVAETVQMALEFARGAMKGRINGANLPGLIENLLELVLREKLNLAEATALERAVDEILEVV